MNTDQKISLGKQISGMILIFAIIGVNVAFVFNGISVDTFSWGFVNGVVILCGLFQLGG